MQKSASGASHKRWLSLVSACLLLATAASTTAERTEQSSLSRWLSRSVVPELREHLTDHPRFQGSPVQLATASNDGTTISFWAAFVEISTQRA